ncbi:MAG: mannonate dehydratase [Candidatus Solibacter usitatus]|nr:mannonate dehydratase [Candidatus Solibacter usitatus]
MKRRHFLSSSSLAAVGALGSASPAAAQGKRALMKLGCQSGPTTDKRLQFFKRHSVNNICGYPGKETDARGYPTVEELVQLRERCEKHGISCDLLAPPFLASSHIDRTKLGAAIMLGQSPQRDREIEMVQTWIKNCAKAGIPAIKYNMSILGVVRTERTPGRGGTTYSTWRFKEAKPVTPLTKAGPVNADVYWERITYFLDRVIPVANEFKIRMACHPHDPGMPPEGYQGVDTVLGTPDGLKKFISIRESPYHGLNFCQGTVSEMLHDPGKEIFDVIRYFGSRQKIFNVHFRNIRGRRNDFQEVYPDEGDIDFVQAMKVYKEVGYPYMMMPDHVPHHPDDPSGDQAFAFAYGYIRALIQAVA